MKKMIFILMYLFMSNQNILCMDDAITSSRRSTEELSIACKNEDCVLLHAKLFKAIKKNQLGKAQTIVFQNPKIVNKHGVCPVYGDQIPALLYISRVRLWDSGELLHTLLKYGANPNATDSEGNTILHLPKDHIHKKHLAYLLQYGFDIDQKNKIGRTPLMEHIDKRSEMAKDIMKFSANINAQDNDGKTALHHAYEMRAFEIADLLWGEDIDEDIIDNKGRKAIDMLGSQDQEMKDVCIQAFNIAKERRKSDLFEFSYRYLSNLLDKQISKDNYDDLYKIHIQLQAMSKEDFLHELERFGDYEKSIFYSIRNGRNFAFIIKKEKQRRKRERRLAIKKFIDSCERGNGMSNTSEVD